jgi:hypothetical protein
MTGIIEFSSDTLNIEVSGINQEIPIDVVEVIFTGQDVYIDVENSNGVLAVNGRAGFVTLDKSDVGLENVENISIVSTSGYLQNQIDQLDTGYASQSEFNLLSGNLTEQINLLSGEFDENNILGYTLELNSGIENLFVPYPALLNEKPSSVTCSLQNFVDNVIYHYMIGQTTMSGFFINFSDVLTNSGYLLNVKIKK